MRTAMKAVVRKKIALTVFAAAFVFAACAEEDILEPGVSSASSVSVVSNASDESANSEGSGESDGSGESEGSNESGVSEKSSDSRGSDASEESSDSKGSDASGGSEVSGESSDAEASDASENSEGSSESAVSAGESESIPSNEPSEASMSESSSSSDASSSVAPAGGTTREDAISIAENFWTNGSVNVGSERWFSFIATVSTQYIYVEFGSLADLLVQVYDSNGNAVGSQIYCNDTTMSFSRSVTIGQKYFVRVRPYYPSDDGTYKLTFTSLPSLSLWFNKGVTAMAANTWTGGNLADEEQWFSFTATAATQYIHTELGTLADMYAQLYDERGNAVGVQTRLYSSTLYLSRSLTIGQRYYVQIRPYNTGGSGAYTIGFNVSFLPPGIAVTALTANTWADGNITVSGGVQWFRFTATAAMPYIHVDFGTLTDLYAQVYTSSGGTVGTEINLYSSTRSFSRSVTTGQEYYVRVRPYSSSGSGMYKIGFTASATPPGVILPTENVTTLTVNTWADGSVSANGTQWFSFTATATAQFIHVEFGSLTQVYVQVYGSTGNAIGNEINLSGSTRSFSRTHTTGEEYYIRIRPYSSGYSGTYKIGFNTSIIPPDTNVSTLTANTWAESNISSSGEQQWLSFTATAATQYIHVEVGSLANVYIQVYTSGGDAVSGETTLSRSTPSLSRSVTTGQEYYVRVRPYSGDGTYKIGFTSSSAPPGVILPTEDVTPLTASTWAGGSVSTAGEQWYSFTASAWTQWFHVEFDTLTNLYMQIYDSSGNTIGVEASLTGSTRSLSRSLTTGQQYYVRVRPYSSSYSGLYKIAFNSLFVPPVTVTALTANAWVDGSVSIGGEQWFSFTATAATQYIHIEFGSLMYMSVQVYTTGGGAVSSTGYSSSSTLWSLSSALTSGQQYYIRVWPSSGYSGTYKITFNTMLGTAAAALTENIWANGSVSATGTQWFRFTATASTQFIHIENGTLQALYAQVYDWNGNTVESEGVQSSPGGSGFRYSYSRTLTIGQQYYIRVRPYSSSYSGAYKIAFNASIIPPDTDVTALTENTWADGSISTSVAKQWFSFAATASTQFIHIAFGTLSTTYGLYVQVYDKSGAVVGSEVNLSGTTRFIVRTLQPGAEYYVQVRRYSSSYSGTYTIVFNTIPAPPDAVTLTENTWVSSSISYGGVQWYRFMATAATQHIHFSDSNFSALSYITMYDGNGNVIGGQNSEVEPSGSYSVTSGQEYYIWMAGWQNSGAFSYGIAFNALPFRPGTAVTTLTANNWASGNMSAGTDVRWFSFTATASMQWIHSDFDNENTSILVRVFDSIGNLAYLESRQSLRGGEWLYPGYSDNYRSRSCGVISGQVYYVRVSPPYGNIGFGDYYVGGSGTYWIKFNTSSSP